MKRSTIFIFPTLLAHLAFAQPGVPPTGDVWTLLSGEHTPVIFSGAGEASVSADYTTQWMQICYSPDAPSNSNHNISRYNPEHFTLGVKLSLTTGGDTALVHQARFEIAYDTTSTIYWNGDSSNIFISSDAFRRSDYGVWTFDPVNSTTEGRLFPLRIFQGGYLRFSFSTTTSDAVGIDWTLTGEH